MNTRPIRQQSGFTLVEIAIVLVIIGLLLGGVLKGTEMIDNSRVKRSVSDVNGIAAAFHSYRDRYRRFPGDDGDLAALQARGGSWANITVAGNANGALVASLAQTFVNTAAETTSFWQAVRAAGFITGDPSTTGAAALPVNAFGGFVGITSASMGGGLTGVKVCLSQVPGVAALSLDTQLDDGDGRTGSLRATLGTENTNTAPVSTVLAEAYVETNFYTICQKI
jgi:prepilin-type N-terminal cleavage/methylation domain-containing protein